MPDTPRRIDWFKEATGQSRQDTFHVPTRESTIRRYLESGNSRYPLITLGWTQDSEEVTLAEEQRGNTHILGLMGSGKSKLLEFFIRHDIDRLRKGVAPGLCLIDSSDFGNTFKGILRYCRKVDFRKVCLIDAGDVTAFNRVPLLNLFGPVKDGVYTSSPSYSADRVQAIFRILWQTEDPSAIARINQNLSSMTAAVHKFLGNLHDFQFFASRWDDEYNFRRRQIVSQMEEHDIDAVNLTDMFEHSSQAMHNVEFKSSIRRLYPMFKQEELMLMFGTTRGIRFDLLIRNGWIILCNLDPRNMGIMSRRLLGTCVIDQVIHAMYALHDEGYTVPFYLYIDEVGQYATQTLADVIHYKRTSNVKLIMAHQQWSQLAENKKVLEAIKTCPLKFLFASEREDRDQMVDLMYGGSLPDREVSYTLSQSLTRRKAVYKIGTTHPRIIRLPDVPDIPEDPEADEKFKKALYTSDRFGWYDSPENINQEINARFGKAQPRVNKSISRKTDTSPVESTGGTGFSRKDQTGSGSTERGDVPDDRPDSRPVLPDKKRRATRKVSSTKNLPKKS